MDRKRIKEILNRLKKAHMYCSSGSSEQQGRLLDVLQPLIEEAEALGVKKGFCEALLFWGVDFLDFDSKETVIKTQRVFGIRARRSTFGERALFSKKGRVYRILTGVKPKSGDVYHKIEVLL